MWSTKEDLMQDLFSALLHNSKWCCHTLTRVIIKWPEIINEWGEKIYKCNWKINDTISSVYIYSIYIFYFILSIELCFQNPYIVFIICSTLCSKFLESWLFFFEWGQILKLESSFTVNRFFLVYNERKTVSLTSYCIWINRVSKLV